MNMLRTLIFEQSSCRAQLVQVTNSWQKILSNNPHPFAVQKILGEMVAASTLLCASLKFDGSLIIQIQGDGPVRLLVAECNSKMGVRAVVKMAPGNEVVENANFADLVNIHGKGICSIILDPFNRLPGQVPYQGIVPLTGNTVSESLEAYMRSSEQLETRLLLNADEHSSAGIMLQQMPQSGGKASEKTFDPDGWDRLSALVKTLQPREHLDTEPDELARRLFSEEEPLTLAKRQVHFECSCSREKVSNMLLALGREEIEEALCENPTVEIQCDFCNTHYSFSPPECAALFAESSGKPPTLH